MYIVGRLRSMVKSEGRAAVTVGPGLTVPEELRIALHNSFILYENDEPTAAMGRLHFSITSQYF